MMVWIVSVDGSSRKSAWARQSSHACEVGISNFVGRGSWVEDMPREVGR